MLGGVVNGKTGEEIEAGLPNITGTYGVSASQELTALDGASYWGEQPKTGKAAYFGGFNTINKGSKTVLFSAKKSNSLYGASETVQMAAHFVVYWKRVE